MMRSSHQRQKKRGENGGRSARAFEPGQSSQVRVSHSAEAVTRTRATGGITSTQRSEFQTALEWGKSGMCMPVAVVGFQGSPGSQPPPAIEMSNWQFSLSETDCDWKLYVYGSVLCKTQGQWQNEGSRTIAFEVLSRRHNKRSKVRTQIALARLPPLTIERQTRGDAS
jgi:hypothetical protein